MKSVTDSHLSVKMRGDQLKVPIYIGQPVAGAPYTPAIQSNGLIFVSGQNILANCLEFRFLSISTAYEDT